MNFPTENPEEALFNSSANAPGSSPLTNQIGGKVMVAPGKAMIRCQQPRIGEQGGESSWEEVTASVAQNAKAFELLHRIIAKPDFDFPIHYERGVNDLGFTNLHFVEERQAALRLETAAFCALRRGDTAAAVTHLRAILAIAHALRNERLTISLLVRISIAQIGVDVTWEILQAPGLTDAKLDEIQRDWACADFGGIGESELLMERVTGQISLAKLRASNAAMEGFIDQIKKTHRTLVSSDSDEGEGLWTRIKTSVKVFLWRYWWSYPDQLRALQGYQVLLDTTRQARTSGSFKAALDARDVRLEALGITLLTNEFDSIVSGRLDFHAMQSESVPTLSGVTRRVMAAEAAKEIVVTAIGLRRYQIKYGKRPPVLDSLVPEFLTKVPLDPVDGRPLRYRPNADGTFLLYSVGPNGADDGGDPSHDETGLAPSTWVWVAPHALDWVWPQPATKEEVEGYLKKKATRRGE